MNKNVKQLWINALQSGEYKQGSGCLLSCSKEGDKKFCCLGVLVDLFEKEHILTFTKHSSGFGPNHQYALPSIVALWSGVSRRQESILMELNDKEISFGSISKIIDMFPEEVQP
jgi:hypothetical protein